MGPIALVAGAILASLASVCAGMKPRVEQRIMIGAMIALSVAGLHLGQLLVSENTSYEIVVDHTRPGLGLARRVMGLWGGSAGSLLVFTLIVGWTLVIAPLRRPLALCRPLVVAVLAWATTLAVDPFARLDTPAIAGSGLSPILEHWAMLIHPPLLYLGLALALVPAAVDEADRRRWTVASLAVLTTALALGGGWAYVELGWGGWWAWDPVENAALIPWLLLVATLHAPVDHRVTRWAALTVWPVVFAGTAMTRTSLRTSVHAFANNDTLGWALWPLVIIVSTFAVVHGIRSAGGPNTTMPRPTMIPVGLLLAAAVVVTLGTFRPFVPGDATDGAFYARFLYPVAILGLPGLGVIPRIRRVAPVRLLAEASVGALLGILSGAGVGWSTWWQLVFAGALGAALMTTVGDGPTPWPRTLAHVGMVCVLAGALGGTASTTQTFSLALDASESIDGVTVTNRGVELDSVAQPVLTATIDVDGTQVRPSLTIYPQRRLRLPEVATVKRVHQDVQVILRSADDYETATVTVNVEPLTQFVWLGASLIVFAMFIRLFSRDENGEVR